MRKLLFPFVKFAQWIGSIARYLWTFNRPKEVDYILDKSLQAKETKKNRIVGTSVISICLTILGIGVSVTPSDVKELEKTMTKSFNRMEQLEYITANTNALSQDTMSQNMIYRGEAQLLSMMLRSQIEFYKTMNIKGLNNIREVDQMGKGALKSYIMFMDHFEVFGKGVMKYVSKNELLAPKTYDVSLSYMNQLVMKLVEVDRLARIVKPKIEEKFTEIEKIPVKDKNRRKLAKLYEKMLDDKDVIRYDIAVYEYIDMVYEYLIALELGKAYSNFSFQENDNIELNEQLKIDMPIK